MKSLPGNQHHNSGSLARPSRHQHNHLQQLCEMESHLHIGNHSKNNLRNTLKCEQCNHNTT